MPRTSPSELLMRQRLGALTRALPAAQEGSPVALHQARVATRRLRAALPLIASGSRQKKLEHAVRKLTRALGPVRELDVELQLLEEMQASGEVPRPAVARLRRAVLEERRTLHRDMLAQLEDYDVGRLRKRALSATRKRVEQRAATSRDPAQRLAARARAARRAAVVAAAVGDAGGLYLPDRLHRVRVAVKKLRYALEVVASLGGARVDAQVRALKQVQDLLGRMHDLEVLIARTRDVQGSSSAPTLKLSGELDRLVRRLENECRQLHGRYSATRPALIKLCEQTIAAGSRGAKSVA
jgi:CHAD domain-containing protein